MRIAGRIKKALAGRFDTSNRTPTSAASSRRTIEDQPKYTSTRWAVRNQHPRRPVEGIYVTKRQKESTLVARPSASTKQRRPTQASVGVPISFVLAIRFALATVSLASARFMLQQCLWIEIGVQPPPLRARRHLFERSLACSLRPPVPPRL